MLNSRSRIGLRGGAALALVASVAIAVITEPAAAQAPLGFDHCLFRSQGRTQVLREALGGRRIEHFGMHVVSILGGAATFGIRGNHARAWGNAPMPQAPASIRVKR